MIIKSSTFPFFLSQNVTWMLYWLLVQKVASNRKTLAQRFNKWVFIFFTCEAWRQGGLVLAYLMLLVSQIPFLLSKLAWWLQVLLWHHCCCCVPVTREGKRWKGYVAKGYASKSLPLHQKHQNTARKTPLMSWTRAGHLAFPGQSLAKGTEKTLPGLEQFVLCGWGRGLATLINTFGLCY